MADPLPASIPRCWLQAMQALAPHCALDPLTGRARLDHLEQRVAALEAALAEHQRLLSRRD